MRVDDGLVHRVEGDAPVALTIGTFDGVHVGHLALLDEVRSVAARLGAQTCLLTFHPHPRCVLDPAHCPQCLTTVAEKRDVLEAWGLDRMVVLPFTRQVSNLSAKAFCDQLRLSFDLRALVIGYDFALGHKRRGDFAFLRAYGDRHGIEVVRVTELTVAMGEVSSSRIRALVAAGDVAGAGALLGRPYFADARVSEDEPDTRALGYPTVDLTVAGEKCLPLPGVYAAWLRARGSWHMALTNVGYSPAFGGDRLTVEASVIDGPVEAAGEAVRCVFIDRVREERSFAAQADLVVQTGRDAEQARAVLARSGSPPVPVS